MLPLVASHVASLIAPEALHHTATTLNRAWPPASYADRLMVGRRAQLGDDMVYRPSTIGCAVDSALTYGEYDLSLFAACVDRALIGLSPACSLTFVDCGSGSCMGSAPCANIAFCHAASRLLTRSNP